MQGTQCRDCKRYAGLQQCEAYPKQIPLAIYTGKHDHRQPYPNDNGIRFEKQDDS